MKIKVVMNSGKEYVIFEESYSVNDFQDSLYTEMPVGGKVLKNGFIYLDSAKKIIVNPAHISSIEVLKENMNESLKTG
ncbi:hypothetical protein [Metabacillus fastidiosus]|uniref:Uncharacterized protein n=1 Tax=Metabacillus fastidiosus TaxID=1458 RepID=A0ABU6NS57_9BACI|nr:hypothetical protein [Metabacillus fastidiosus]MEC2078488.1 hypothetical protein [Metabacillus fastidiosus]MED4399979.1 hypothetical protein [Metabacillus fastidiosus]MED4452152.1 hypothetical protein [Metabacillus fastidiosus]MED4462463.1 hypothetical protein [Metabacillus fastidiosus]MED4531790.1 hypothetical protein [Metabacillus fastidiosus]